jgi:hypothetical protein
LIDFRYHLVSIIAIFVALALGVILGSGPLDDPIDNTLRQRYEQVEDDKEALRGELNDADTRISYLNRASSTYNPAVVGDRLTGRSVVVLTMPGVDGGLVNDMRELLELSGADITGTVSLTDDYADPQRLGELEELLEQLTPADADIPDNARPYARAAAVLARGVVADAAAAGDGQVGADPTVPVTPEPPDAGVEADSAAQALLSGLQDNGFLTVDGDPQELAELAVLLAPAAPEQADDAANAVARAQLEIALAVDRRASGSVVAGPLGSAEDAGLVQVVRRDDEADGRVSTVDMLDTVPGRTSTALALLAQATDDTTGHYGIGPDADDVAPAIPARPEPTPETT